MRCPIILLVLFTFIIPAEAAIVDYTPGSGWQQFSFSGTLNSGTYIPNDYSHSDDSYRFTLTEPRTLELVNLGWPAEAFSIFDNGIYTGLRTYAYDVYPMPFWGYEYDKPEFGQRYASFDLDAGTHEIHFYLQQYENNLVDESLGSEARLINGFRVIPEPATLMILSFGWILCVGRSGHHG